MSLTNYLLCDIECVGRDDAAQYVKAASNLRDPTKVAASIEERKGELGLDPNGSRLVVIGTWASGSDAPTTTICKTETQEMNGLLAFWKTWNAVRKADFDAKIIGYVCRTFDMLHLIRRSQLLGVPHPRVRLNRYQGGDVFDLFEEITFFGEQKTAVVPRSLDVMATLFKLTDVPADKHCGADVAGLIAAGDYEAVAEHCRCDLHRTRALAERLGVIDTARTAPVRKLANLDIGG